MKIMLCHNYYQIPGGEDEVFHSERAMLEEHGHQVEIYTRHNDEIAKLPNWKVAAQTLWSRQTVSDLRDRLKTFQPDLLHCTNTFPLISPSVHSLAKRLGIRTVQSVHNYRFACMGGMCEREGSLCTKCVGKSIPIAGIRHRCYRDSLLGSGVVGAYLVGHRWLGTWRRKVDRFILLSRSMKDVWDSAGMPGDKVSVKPNFVKDDPGFSSTGNLDVVFAGRLAPEKGLSVLLDAWKKIKQDQQSLTGCLRIFGDGPLRKLVEEAARNTEGIIYEGWTPLNKVMQAMKESRCVVVPTVSYEPFGLVVIQAFAGGTPVIASDRGTLSELVQSGMTGFRFEPGKADSLAAEIKRCFELSATEYESMRTNARLQYENNYTRQANYQRLMEIYEATLNEMTATKGVEHVASQS